MSSFRRALAMALGAATLWGAANAGIRRLTAARSDADYFGGKNVVITGGSRGLGFVLAGMLLEAGANVTVCGRSAVSLESARQKFGAFGSRFIAVHCDVRDRAACRDLIRDTAERLGSIDVLVNNAGIIEVGAFADQTIADFEDAMATHFWAPLSTTLAVLPAMRARRSGHIINVASIGGVVGVPHLVPYSASKFAQVGLSQALGAELASEGITVTSIVPGLMLTGSPDNAIFKGNNRAEYAWFTLSDASPLLSVSANSAARRIMRAIRRREAHVAIGITAGLATTLNALLPELTATLLKLGARLLPAPGGNGATSRTGVASRSAWTQNVLTYFNRRAIEQTNQSPAIDEQLVDVTPVE